MLVESDKYTYNITDCEDVTYSNIIEWINSNAFEEEHKYIMKELADIKYTGKIIINSKEDGKCIKKIYIINGSYMMINDIKNSVEYYLDTNIELSYYKITNRYVLYYDSNKFTIQYYDLSMDIEYIDHKERDSFALNNKYIHLLSANQLRLTHFYEHIIEKTKSNIMCNVVNTLILSK
jgi:hypothetical protein